MKEEKTENFFIQKTNEYLKTPEHVAKMNERLDELFRFKVSIYPGELYFNLKNGMEPEKNERVSDYEFYQMNSTDSLFRQIAEKNESWDQLLLASEYRLFNSSVSRIANDDQSFFQPWLSSKEMLSNKLSDFYPELQLLQSKHPSDPRLAGILSSYRFYERYVNSSTNLNRRRAAAIFNIFLCDKMRPVQTPGVNDDQNFINQSLNLNTNSHAKIFSQVKNIHANNPSCASCHYKLDPMASLFYGIGSALPTTLTSGALIYKINNRTINIPVKGLRKLAEAIIKQNEYTSCQVHHFWDWFMGTNVPLSSTREKELISAFNLQGRRANSFISFLVNQPEFYHEPQAFSTKVLLHAKAIEILKDCNSCHSISHGPPSLSQFPIGGTQEKHQQWINKISDSLNLDHHSMSAAMPPAGSGWDQSYINTSKETLRSWICQGAPDASGKPTLDKLPGGVCEKN